MKKIKKQFAFTIVELLVVIVVIGVLAAITIVSYSGITSRANIVSLQSDLANASQQLKLYQTLYGSYPTLDSNNCPVSPSIVDSNYCLKATAGTAYQYTVSSVNSRYIFCTTATKNSYKYNISPDTTSLAGPCPEISLDAGNKTSYPGIGSTWTDLSGKDNNGTLYGGVTYNSANGGVMSFDGANDYIGITSAPNMTTSGSLSVWVYVNSWGSQYDSIIFKGPGISWADVDYVISRNVSSNTFLGSVNDGTNNLMSGGPQSSTITVGQWYYLVFTWDSSVAKFYTNSTQTGSVNWSHGAGARSNNLNIGSAVGGGTYFLNGLISNVKIYSSALSASDVLQNFNATKGRYGL